MTDVGPPEGNASDKDAERAVHEFKIANAKPSMARGEKCRFNSALWPRAAKWASSFGWCTTLSCLAMVMRLQRQQLGACMILERAGKTKHTPVFGNIHRGDPTPAVIL